MHEKSTENQNCWYHAQVWSQAYKNSSSFVCCTPIFETWGDFFTETRCHSLLHTKSLVLWDKILSWKMSLLCPKCNWCQRSKNVFWFVFSKSKQTQNYKQIRVSTFSNNTEFTYRKVASSNMSRLEAHVGFFSLLMKRIFDPYVLWSFDKN